MRNILFALVMLISLNAWAQQKTINAKPSLQGRATVETRALLQALGDAKSTATLPQALRTMYPTHVVRGVETIGILTKVNHLFNPADIQALGGNARSRMGDIVSMRIPLSALSQIEHVKGIVSFSVAHWAAPMMDKARFDMHADSVLDGMGLPQAFDGTDVLIGITDWGFDYKHPNLNRSRNPRIERAWDQYRQAGPAPNGFDYGTELIGYDALAEAGGDTANLYDYGTHGTHVAGITGGNGYKDSTYKGIATGAHWLLGSWFLDEASWMDEVYWMWQVAKESNKRLVVNSSWGMYSFSNLDGSSLLSQAINSLSDSGVVFCTSAGNNGDTKFHIKKEFTEEPDTLKTIPNWYTYVGNAVGQAIIMWGTPEDANGTHPFHVRFGMARNPGEIYWSDWISSNDASTVLDGRLALANGDTCEWNALCEARNVNDNRPHILLNVFSVPGYTLHVWITSNVGSRVDAWNVVNLTNHAGNMGADFKDLGLVGYSEGDYLYGIGEPGCAAKTITVAAHQADHILNGNYRHGFLANFSSHGPAYGDYAKPEISAPGVSVNSSVSSRATEPVSNTSATTMSGGKPYSWAPLSGTSMSSPAVSGLVALMLQANPNITVEQIRNILFTTARNDEATGEIHASGQAHNDWGWGKANAMAAVTAAYNLLDLEEAQRTLPQLLLYPNPTQGMLTVLTHNGEPEVLEIFNIMGSKIMSRSVNNGETLQLALPHGIYVVRCTGKLGSRTEKLIIQ